MTPSGGACVVTAGTLEPSRVNFVRAADFKRFVEADAGASPRAAEQPARNRGAAHEFASHERPKITIPTRRELC